MARTPRAVQKPKEEPVDPSVLDEEIAAAETAAAEAAQEPAPDPAPEPEPEPEPAQPEPEPVAKDEPFDPDLYFLGCGKNNGGKVFKLEAGLMRELDIEGKDNADWPRS